MPSQVKIQARTWGSRLKIKVMFLRVPKLRSSLSKVISTIIKVHLLYVDCAVAIKGTGIEIGWIRYRYKCLFLKQIFCCVNQLFESPQTLSTFSIGVARVAIDSAARRTASASRSGWEASASCLHTVGRSRRLARPRRYYQLDVCDASKCHRLTMKLRLSRDAWT